MNLAKERSHSGLVRSLGKRVTCQRVRGFESPPLRHRFAEANLRRDKVRHGHSIVA